MATKFAQSSGNYDKDVCDSGESAKKYLYDSPGQDKKKFSNFPTSAVKDYSGVGGKQKLSQKATPPMDSGEGQGRQSNEGGQPKPSAPKGSNKMKAPKRGAM